MALPTPNTTRVYQAQDTTSDIAQWVNPNNSVVASIAHDGTFSSATQGDVISVFGRSGTVVAVSGDYTVAEVTGAAPLASPTFSGTPSLPTGTTAVTQSTSDSSTKLATTAFVATGFQATSAINTFGGYPQLVAAPASATAAGAAGQISYDATHFYQCIATNTWVRATLATW